MRAKQRSFHEKSAVFLFALGLLLAILALASPNAMAAQAPHVTGHALGGFESLLLTRNNFTSEACASGLKTASNQLERVPSEVLFGGRNLSNANLSSSLKTVFELKLALNQKFRSLPAPSQACIFQV